MDVMLGMQEVVVPRFDCWQPQNAKCRSLRHSKIRKFRSERSTSKRLITSKKPVPLAPSKRTLLSRSSGIVVSLAIAWNAVRPVQVLQPQQDVEQEVPDLRGCQCKPASCNKASALNTWSVLGANCRICTQGHIIVNHLQGVLGFYKTAPFAIPFYPCMTNKCTSTVADTCQVTVNMAVQSAVCCTWSAGCAIWDSEKYSHDAMSCPGVKACSVAIWSFGVCELPSCQICSASEPPLQYCL